MNGKQGIEKNLFNSKNQLNSRRIKHNNKFGLKDNFSQIFNQIFTDTNFLDSDALIKQRLYHLYNNIPHRIYCEYCKENETSFISFSKGYSKYCSMECVGKSEEVINNRKTSFEFTDGEERDRKSKETKKDRHGDENFNNVKKAQETNLEKYGVKCTVHHPEIKEKVKETNRKKFGHNYYFGSEQSKENYQRFLKENGVINISQIEEVKRKKEESCLKSLGVLYPSQCPEVYEKIIGFKNSGHYYQLPSGQWIRLQGYEPQILDELLEIYKEIDILHRKTDMPEIGYIGNDEKQHRYYPDFYIPKDSLVIEVKSTYTYDLEINTNKLKENATKKLGFDFDFIVK